MRPRAPYRRGDRITVLHACKHHALAITTFVVAECRRQHRLTDVWVVRTVRCDGSPLEVVTDGDGFDDAGLVAPDGGTPAQGGVWRHGAAIDQPDVFDLLAEA